MSEPVALDDIKAHLRLDAEATDEDTYLDALLLAARRLVEHRINRPLLALADPDLEMVRHAIRLIVGDWYANRESTNVGNIVNEMPNAAGTLLAPLRSWTGS